MKKNRLLTELPDSLKGVDIKSILRRRGIYDKLIRNKQLKEAAIPIARKLISSKKKPVVAEVIEKKQRNKRHTNPRIDMDLVAQLGNVVDSAEKQFHNKIEQFIGYIQKGFLADFDTSVSSKKTLVNYAKKDYFSENEDELLVKATLDFNPILKNVAKESGQEALNLTGISQPYLIFDYDKQIKENIEKFTKSMLETERQSLSNIVSNGLQSGQSVPEIRGSIVEAFGTYSRSQAERITRTEVMRASNEATLDAYKQSGVVEGKQWLTAGAVDECEQYEGQIVGLEGSFYNSQTEFENGDPPLHPNCRCVLVPVLENDYAGASLFHDERGFIDIVDDPSSSEFTAYHGHGMNLNNEEIATFGRAFYVSKDPAVASLFGDVTKLNIPFGSGSIYTVHTAREYNQLIGDAFIYARDHSLDTSKAASIPAYIRSLGYKAVQFTPEAAHAIDEWAGIGIVDLKLMKKLNRQLGTGKAIIMAVKDDEKIEYLESLLDKRTKEAKELISKRADDKVYIKSLEKYLGVADEPPEET